MGAAWCRNRAAAASNSKSPIDRVLVQCVSQICPSTEACRSTWHLEPEHTFEKAKVRPQVSEPVPVHQQPTRPQRSNHHIHVISQSSWQDVSLSVPDSSPPSFGVPVPPPRKKRQMRITKQQEQCLENAWKRIARPPPPQPPTEPSSWPTSGENGTLRANKRPKKQRAKSLSSVSLPNSHELSLALHIPAQKTSSSSPKNECNSSPSSKGFSSLSTVEKIENCVRRCKSFGAFKSAASSFSEPTKGSFTKDDGGWMSSESDDSFDGLDDWDIRVIEHYDAPGEDDGPKTRSSTKTEPTQIRPPQRRRHSSNKVPADLISGKEASNEHSENNDSIRTTNTANESNVVITEELMKSGFSVTQNGDLTSNAKEAQESTNRLNSAQQNCDKVIVFDFVKPKTTSSTLNLPPSLHNGFCKSTGDNPTGLKTPPPSPEGSTTPAEKYRAGEKDTTKNETRDNEGDVQHSPLLRLLNEFRSSNTDIKGSDLTNGLGPIDDGYLATRKDIMIGSRCSSGRSSMTPSLSELEAALSDLLESSKTGPEEDDDDEVHPLVANPEASSNSSSIPPMLNTNVRVVSTKPLSNFTSSFHSLPSMDPSKSEGHHKMFPDQHSQISEAPA